MSGHERIVGCVGDVHRTAMSAVTTTRKDFVRETRGQKRSARTVCGAKI